MKLTRLFIATMLLGMLSVSCSNDNEPIKIEKPLDFQKEIGKEMPFTGSYAYTHSGNAIPFIFEEQTITIQMSAMSGSQLEDSTYEVITLYQNKENTITKVVAQDKSVKTYKAFFFKNFSTPNVDINIDYTFNTEIEAIQAVYPPEQGLPVDHNKNQFGWLKLTESNQTNNEINLPITGKYVFESQSFSYYYTFTNEVINFNGTYDMQILLHNKNTDKILLKGMDEERSTTYYVIQLKEIDAKSVQIARGTYNDTKAKENAEKEFASASELPKQFSTYTQESLK